MRAPAANQLNFVAFVYPMLFELFYRVVAIHFLFITSFEVAGKLWLHFALLCVQVSLLIHEEILAKFALYLLSIERLHDESIHWSYL